MKYILISLGVLLLIIFGIVVFNRGGSETATQPGKKAIKLSDFETNSNAAVEYTIEGAINSIENHRSIQMNIGPTGRTLTVYTGYQGQILKTQTLPNDNGSYGDFIAALARAGFVKERRIDSNISSQSVCPTGSRTHYKIIDGSEDVMNLWSASCTSGSYAGNVSLTTTLFRNQFPNYSEFTQGVSLGTTGGSSAGIF